MYTFHYSYFHIFYNFYIFVFYIFYIFIGLINLLIIYLFNYVIIYCFIVLLSIRKQKNHGHMYIYKYAFLYIYIYMYYRLYHSYRSYRLCRACGSWPSLSQVRSSRGAAPVESPCSSWLVGRRLEVHFAKQSAKGFTKVLRKVSRTANVLRRNKTPETKNMAMICLFTHEQ